MDGFPIYSMNYMLLSLQLTSISDTYTLHVYFLCSFLHLLALATGYPIVLNDHIQAISVDIVAMISTLLENVPTLTQHILPTPTLTRKLTSHSLPSFCSALLPSHVYRATFPFVKTGRKNNRTWPTRWETSSRTPEFHK